MEFPDRLLDIVDDYNAVSDNRLPDRMNAFANKKGDPAAAKECQRLLAIVDRITPRVSVEPADDGWTPEPGEEPEHELTRA